MTTDQLLSVGALILSAVVAFALRTFFKSEQVTRVVQAIPVIISTIRMYVDEAERLSDSIMESYEERAKKEDMHPKLLWVIDQVEVWVKKQFGFDVDLNWMIAQIESYLQSRKQ